VLTLATGGLGGRRGHPARDRGEHDGGRDAGSEDRPGDGGDVGTHRAGDLKSQSKSQQPQTRGVTRLQPATVVAGRCHIGRYQATSSAGRNLPYKRGVTGSNPVAPTKFPQVDGLFETLIGDPVTTAGNHRCMLPDGGRVPSGHGRIPFDHEGAPCADGGHHRHWSSTQGRGIRGARPRCCMPTSLWA
jgi:hypothetical protein